MKKYTPTQFEFQVSEYTIAYKSLSTEAHYVKNSKDAVDILNPHFAEFHGIKEAFYAIYLNRANKVIGIHKCSDGGISGCIVDPRIVLRPALELLASSIVLAHNHPSGNLKPSPSDRELTQKIKQGANLFDINVIDHVILTEHTYLSFADEGLL